MKQENQNSKQDVKALLKSATSVSKKKEKDVVYGIYDESDQSLFTRIDDFLINHSRVSLEEKAYFFHLLAVMIDAGIPLIQALKLLSKRAKSERFRRVLNTIAYNVGEGKKFSESMARFPDIFGEMEVGIVRSGEAAGNMDKMLFKLSDQIEKSHALQVKLVTASIYPLAVLGVLVVVAAAMLVWVIPSLVNLLREGGLADKDFPFATRFLMGFSNVVVSYWWAILFAIITSVLLFSVYKSSDNGRFKWDLFKLKFPVIGSLLRRVMVLRFISMLGILIESGLPVIYALQIIATSLSSELYRLKTWEIIADVQRGEKISDSLAASPFLFPETVSQMISVAEQSASIGIISEKVAAHYDLEIDNSLKRLTSLFEPVMIIFVGITVAMLALAILTPIFQLSQLV